MKRVLALLLMMLLFTVPALASEGTAYTYTLSVNGEWARTQDAYLPGAIFLRGQQLSSPEDLCIHGDTLYVADTGNSRVVAYNMTTGRTAEIGRGMFRGPTGLYAASDGKLYVADYQAAAVFVLDASGRLLLKITRPRSALFGSDSPFKPRKVLADAYGNIYVVGEGSYQGMMLFNKTGQFVGYYGSNRTSITVLERLQDLIFTEQQLEQLFNRIPDTIYNAAPGSDGLIYSVTQNELHNSIKAHNMSGTDVLSNQGNLIDETNFIDIAVSNQGEIYTLTESGYIYEYDPDGNLIFSFGGQSLTTERSGLFTVAAAIDVDSKDVVYVLDKERGLVQAFYPTAYASATHDAILSLSTGNYMDSSRKWESLLKQNGIARMAHEGYARARLLMRDYNTAEQQFYVLRDKTNYSQAFGQLRSQWFSAHFKSIVAVLLLAALILTLLHLLKKRLPFLVRARIKWRRLCERPGFLRDLLFVRHMISHPVDGFYELKKGHVGSLFSAAVLCLAAFAIFLVDTLFCGFPFRTADPDNTPLFSLVLVFFAAFGLFVVSNTLVSSLGSGEGNLHRIFVMTAYAISPYIVFTPVIFLLSYILTLNESFVISMGMGLILLGCGVNLCLGIAETHNFMGREVWKNILLTLFFMIMAVVAVSIVYLLWVQIVEFLKALVKEVIYRARA